MSWTTLADYLTHVNAEREAVAEAEWLTSMRLAALDRKITRCPGCDALVLPPEQMRVRHVCVRTTGRKVA